MPEVDDLWTSCASTIRAQVSDIVWQTTFLDLEARALDGDQLVLTVPSKVVKERIEARYLGILEAAVAEVGSTDLRISIDVDAPTAPDPEQLVFAPDAPVDDVVDLRHHELGGTDNGAYRPGAPISVQPLNDRLTFDNFVAGTSNRFAHAAALAVAETPARSYNPLFIYGDAGLGKTHLLQGIAHYVNSHYPTYTVRYVSSEAFLNQCVEAIRTNRQMEFKRHYRDVDVLLVDDIQFLEGKEGLQEEFFHSFNHLHQANKQIVLSSDRPPDAIPTLEDRLKSRFKMGLTTDIQPPDLETRLAILRKKAETGAPAPDELLEFIARNVTDNIRELEGALTRVTAFANLTQEPLTVELAERVLADVIANTAPRQITPKVILDATSEMFGFSVEDITGASRRRPLVTARQVGMYVCRQLTDMSYPAIAREFGNRDHTTVIHAVEKIDALMRERRQIYDQVTALIQRIKAT